MSARRWVSEANVLDELERLNDLSMAKVQEYAGLATNRAEAEAAHKVMRAKRILKAQHDGKVGTGKAVSVAQAEIISEADDAVAAAYMDRLVTDALADACKEAMRSIRGNQEALRTAAASTRDQIAGPGWSGKR